MARGLSEALRANEGVTAVVENKTGASGHLAAQAAAAADDCTLLVGTATLATNPSSMPKAASVYDALEPVAMLARNPMFFAAKPGETRTLQQMFADAKRTGIPLTYATPGVGSINHLAAEALLKKMGVPGTHVPTKGASEAMQLLLGGQVDFVLDNPTTLAPQLHGARSPKVMGSTSAKPEHLAGVDEPVAPLSKVLNLKAPFEWAAWFGVVAPAKSSGQFKSDAWLAVTKAANAAGFRERFEKLGFEVAPLNRAEFAEFMKKQRESLKPFVLDAQQNDAK